MDTKGLKGKALITGASSGIGAIYADRLAARGFDVVLVARSADRLKAVAEGIGSTTTAAVEMLAADLGTEAGVAAVAAKLREDAAITLLVNNAGVGAVTPLLQTDVDKMDELLAINVGALTRLTYAAVPGFVARGHGTIINIGSTVGVAPEILNGVYGASKAYVLAFSQSLKHEVGDKGVRVQVVLPGATATAFWSVAGLPIENLPKSIVMDAHAMVDAALAGLDQGEFVTIPSLEEAQRWTDYEAARQALVSHVSSNVPAGRYRVAIAA